MFRRGVWVTLFVWLIVSSPPPLAAQSDAACPALVTEALASVNEVCAILGRNDACYGHNRVDVTFWEAPAEDVIFSEPGDRLPIPELQTIATAPLDLEESIWGVAALHVQANVPETLPGQAILFLLMGDATMENAVSPDESAGPVTPARVTVLQGANLRSAPMNTSNVVGTAAAGEVLSAVGVDDQRLWYEVRLGEGGYAWIWNELVVPQDQAATAALPITYGEGAVPRYGPMQAFYLSTGFGDPDCRQAPDALVVQGPVAFEVVFSINELEIQLGSTAIFTVAPLPQDPTAPGGALVGVLVEGTLRTNINGEPVLLDQIGEALAVTLNEEGRVDETSHLAEPPPSAITPLVQNACQNALTAGVFERALFEQDCLAPLAYYEPEPSTPTPRPYVPPPLPTAPPPTVPQPTLSPEAFVSFVADLYTLTAGQCVTLFWTVENIQAVFFEGQPVTGSESRTVCPSATTTYTLSVLTQDGQTIDTPLTVTVTSAEPIISFVADRYTLNQGECATLTWAVANVESVFYDQGINQFVGVTGNESRVECPRLTTTYLLRVYTRTGEVRDTPLTLTVLPATEEPTAGLGAPIQYSPPSGSVFSHFPRTTTLQWSPVPGAATYTVEIDCFHCCATDQWCTDVGSTWQIVPGITGTSYTFNFVGAQPGRWRVWAVDAQGNAGPQTGWWTFEYTQ